MQKSGFLLLLNATELNHVVREKPEIVSLADAILKESLEHEEHALGLYKKLLKNVENASIYLEEYARTMIGQEEQHSLELKKMLKDYS